MNNKETLENEESGVPELETSSPIIMLRSDLAQEIISRRSGFVENWALPIFLVILVAIFAGSWFVHYPDSIATTATINAEHSPLSITVPREGLLTKLLVENGQSIRKGEYIGLIESTADYQQVIALSKQVDQAIHLINEGKMQEALQTVKLNYIDLGELQLTYNQLFYTNAKNVKDYQDRLYAFENEIKAWTKNYAIKAPADGKISFSTPINEGKYLTNGSVLCYIIPPSSDYYAEAQVSQNNLAKVDTGMLVQLKLTAYPSTDWGMLLGKVSYISNVLNQGSFAVTIKLPANSISTDNKKIILRNGLTAEAVIIVNDIRLFQKFYQGFISSTALDK